MVEVTKADRGAAEHWRRNFGRKGTFQDLLEAFAAHREAAEQAERARVVNWLYRKANRIANYWALDIERGDHLEEPQS